MDFSRLIDTLTPEIYLNLKQSLELGKWPNGEKLTQQQKEHTMQAIIAYEARYFAESARTGYIDRGSKADGEQCTNEPDHGANEPSPLKWQ